MRQYSSLQARSDSRNGVALLTVLAFILLLTILIVSFIAFTRLNRLATGSYSNAVQAQEIAKGGLQDIISDLHSEIIAGSSTSAFYTQNGTTIYMPTANYTASPVRLGYASTAWSYGSNVTQTAAPTKLMPTLVRVSRADPAGGTALYPALSGNYSSSWLNRASQASTGNSSLNGRYISPTRWNKPFLLSSCTTTIPTPFYNSSANGAVPRAAGTAYPGTPDLPDWVYVTRNGSQVCTTAEVAAGSLSPSSNLTTTGTTTGSPVIGRYAYVVYDEGALLDANVAGSPSQLIAINTSSTQYTKVVTPLPTYTDATYNTNWAVTGKSFLSFADLGQIPGLYGVATHGSGSNGQPVIDALISWRNNSLATTQGGALTGAQYLGGLITYALNGFTQYQTTGGISDNPLLNRQDLINFFAKIDGTKFNTTTAGAFSQALPYLGTFSRSVSAPNYIPPSDASTLGGANDPGTSPFIGASTTDPGSIYAYNTNAKQSSFSTPFSSTSPNPNPALANVRFANAGTINHYSDLGTALPLTYHVNAGDPLLQSRFSLAKINWLSQANPNTGAGPAGNYVTAIQSCFGLTWGTVGPIANGGNPCWEYVGSPGSTFNGTIETLDQVAKEGREPNFFELLKAAILSGSLGLSPGEAGFANGTGSQDFRAGVGYEATGGVESYDGYSFDRAGTIPAPAGIPDIQIMKIGANIIDQFDADSYPTAIYFHYSYNGGTMLPSTNPNADDAASFTAYPSGTGDLKGPSDMVYGEENLPLLQAVYEFPGTPTATTTNEIDAWWQPELWNPHMQPNTSLLTTAQVNGTPNSFEVRAYGSGYLLWLQESPYPPGVTTLPGGGSGGNTTTQQLDKDYITFNDTTATSSFYASPMGLGSQLSSITNLTAHGPDASHMTVPSMPGLANNDFNAFWIGNDTTFILGAEGTPPPPTYEVYTEQHNGGTGLTFVLGWTDSNAGFHPYSYIPMGFGNTDCILGPEKTDDEHGTAYPYGGVGDAEWHQYTDPRTFRFDTLQGWQAYNFDSTFLPKNGTESSDVSGQGRPSSLAHFTYPGLNPLAPVVYEIGWIANAISPSANTGLYTYNYGTNAVPSYYSDPDGLIRNADGIFGNATYGDGLLTFTSAANPQGNPIPSGDSGGNVQHGRRPIILNRPFRNVGELGYTFRDDPFKTLDFNSALSADAGLLDVFSVADESRVSTGATPNQLNSVVAGEVNLSNAPLGVIQALLSGVSKKDLDPTYNVGIEINKSGLLKDMATAIANQLNPTSGPNPLLNRAALVTQLGPIIQSTFANNNTDDVSLGGDASNKAYIEGPVRALSDVANTRTWNLMIDIIAQSGQIPPPPTSSSLDNFVVQGEKRYWLHIAIDRYTGKVVAQQLEPVYE
jgi:hypothetical protein